MSFLSEHTNKSSMRLNFLLVAIACMLILVCVAVYILILAIKATEITQWTEMGIFCVGVASIITGTAYMKVQQKKVENGNGLN